MKYTDFVIQYNAAKEKEQFVAKHIKKKYMGYAEKVSMADSIAKRASWNDDGKYERNSMLQTWLIQTNMIKYYTDITWEDENVVAAYDALVESGAFEAIFAAIPETEVVQLQGMTEMSMSDIYINFRDIPVWIDTKIEAMGLGLGSIMSGLQDAIKENPEKIAQILQMPNGNSEE